MSDERRIAWLWAYGYSVVDEQEQIDAYIISIGRDVWRIECGRSGRVPVYEAKGITNLTSVYSYSHYDLVNVLNHIGGDNVMWMFTRSFSSDKTVPILTPVPFSGAVESDIVRFNTGDKKVIKYKSWFAGVNENGMACIVSVSPTGVDVEFKTTTDVLANRSGKYINIIGQGGKILLRNKEMRRFNNDDTVMYPKPFYNIYKYYEGVTRGVTTGKSLVCRAYESEYTARVEHGEFNTGDGTPILRYPLVKYYGHFGKNRSSVAIIDALLAEPKEQPRLKHLTLNRFAYATAFHKRVKNGCPTRGWEQAKTIDYLTSFGCANLLKVWHSSDAQKYYTQYLKNLYKEYAAGAARAIHAPNDSTYVCSVPENIFKSIEKFVENGKRICKEIGGENANDMWKEYYTTANAIIRNNKLDLFELSNIWVDNYDTRNDIFCNVVNLAHGVSIDKASHIERMLNKETNTTMWERRQNFRIFLKMISCCIPMVKGYSSDGCTTTLWKAKDAVWYIMNRLKGNNDKYDGAEDIYRVMESVTLFDNDPIRAVLSGFSEELYANLCEFVVTIITHYMQVSVTQGYRLEPMLANFTDKVRYDTADFNKFGFYGRKSAVRIIREEYLSTIDSRAKGMWAWVNYHRDRYIEAVLKKLFWLSGEVEDVKEMMLSYKNLDTSTKSTIFKACVYLRYRLLNPTIKNIRTMCIRGRSQIGVCPPPYHSNAFRGYEDGFRARCHVDLNKQEIIAGLRELTIPGASILACLVESTN